MSKIILDISRYQTVDWDKINTSIIKGIMLKTVSTNYSQFGGLYIDPNFESWYAECKKRNIPVGAYYYTYALDKSYADKELALFNKAISGKSFELPLAVDVEDNSLKPLSTQSLTELVEYAMDTIQSWGAYAVVYTYTAYEKAELDVSRLKAKYDWWVANYTTNSAPEKCGMWQFTSSYKASGVFTNGVQRCDASYAYKDYPSIIKGKFNDFRETVIETVKPLCDEPIRMAVGPASDEHLAFVKELLDKLEIGCEVDDGWIYTDIAISKGDQVKLISLCKDLKLEYKEYVTVTVIEETTKDYDDEQNTENKPTVDVGENEDSKKDTNYTKEQSIVIKFIKWLMRIFNLEG